MAQRHLDRLSSVDAGFLLQEDRGDAHMHIGGLILAEGPVPPIDDVRQHIADRLHLVPRYRQKVVPAPLRSGRPLWVEDPDFNLDYHVRHTALPAPGSTAQLHALVARVAAQRLDRQRPLWEVWLVEGLEGGGWALINKTHHALVDGVGGVDILTALVDLGPEVRTVEAPEWSPAPPPSSLDLLRRGASGVVRNATTLATGLATSSTQAVLHPTDTLRAAAGPLQGAGEIAWKLLGSPAPPSPLNIRPGPHRRFTAVRLPLADFKAVKVAAGGTVNDVVLAAVSGALGEFLRRRGASTEVDLRACVPVSVRTDVQRGGAGNQITIMTCDLPVGVTDPLQRLARVRRTMDTLKRSHQAVAAKLLTQVENFAPPTVLAQASRLGFSSRLYNLLVTNVPGPQFPVYLLGKKVTAVYPIAFLAPEHALAIAIFSYDGHVHVGLLGEYDALHDIEELGRMLEAALRELVEAASQSGAAEAG